MPPDKNDAFVLISQHEHCAVKQNKENQQHGLFASRPFLVGDVIVAFNASKIVETPNYLTVQVSEHKHIHLIPEYLQYVNHCCEPNVLFNTSTMQLECISDIEAGEELRFFIQPPNGELHNNLFAIVVSLAVWGSYKELLTHPQKF